MVARPIIVCANFFALQCCSSSAARWKWSKRGKLDQFACELSSLSQLFLLIQLFIIIAPLALRLYVSVEHARALV